MGKPIKSDPYRVFELPEAAKYIVTCDACGWAEAYDTSLLITLDVKFLRRQAEQHICNPRLELP